jgi:hypothetical protein
MRILRNVTLVLAGTVAPLAVADTAAARLTATGIRVGDHPGFVRVVVDFTGGTVLTGEVVATDPNPFGDGVVRLPLSHRRVRTTAAPVNALGVSASIRQRRGRIVIRLAGAPRRFKYVGYHAQSNPQRLVIDMIKSAPPVPAAEVLTGAGGCLTLRNFAVTNRRVRASGRERDLFEHSLVVRLRRADGRIHAQRPETAPNRRWSTSFRYPRTRRRAGTLEAVALSAKDGTLDCLVQARVNFGG